MRDQLSQVGNSFDPDDMPSNSASNCDPFLLDYRGRPTVLVIIKLTNFSVSVRFFCGRSKLTFCLYFIIFAMLKSVVLSLEPILTPSYSSYSASHQAPNYVQRS